jgi:hypothetical protein
MKLRIIITLGIIFLTIIPTLNAQNPPDLSEISHIIANKDKESFEHDCNSLLQKTYPDYFKDVTADMLELRLTQAACHLAYDINMAAIREGMQTYTSLADLAEAKRDITLIKAELTKFNPGAIQYGDAHKISLFFKIKKAQLSREFPEEVLQTHAKKGRSLPHDLHPQNKKK